MMRRVLRGFSRDTSGQALTEFAIVTPLICMVLLFAIWFYEVIHLKLKVQEATRYATWEATAYPLHDYNKPSSAMGWKMIPVVMADTATRYYNMDSATIMPRLGILSASWTPPIPIMTDRPEDRVPGGTVVNLLFGFGGFIFDLVSGLLYSSDNVVAQELMQVRLFSSGGGGARMARMFGDGSWGFNTNGYICTNMTLFVKNEWFGRGMNAFSNMVMMNPTVALRENPRGGFLAPDHCVLADSWRLNDGSKVEGMSTRPGLSKDTAFWKQVDRMYFLTKGGKSVGKRYTKMFKTMMDSVLNTMQIKATPRNLKSKDFFQTAVVSIPYQGKKQKSGRVRIVQDRGIGYYDTIPVGQNKGGDSLKPYGQTLGDRGKWFMGCDREMSLGCPTATLQQENPFGDYIYRDTKGGSK